MSQHAMKMGFYTINLGTEHGQRLHTCHIGNIYPTHGYHMVIDQWSLRATQGYNISYERNYQSILNR